MLPANTFPLQRWINALHLYKSFLDPDIGKGQIKFVNGLIRYAERVSEKEKAQGRSVYVPLVFLDSLLGRFDLNLRRLELENKKNRGEADALLGNLKAAIEEIKNLQRPPHGFVYFEKIEERDGEFWLRTKNSTALIFSDELVEKLKTARIGQRVRLNESGVAIELLDEFEKDGEVVQVMGLLGDGRIKISREAGGESVVSLASCVNENDINIGDKVLLSRSNNMIIEKLSKDEVADLVLEEVPDHRWDDIGGLDEQTTLWRDEVETNILHPESAVIFKIKPTKGVLVCGPPGCGKTLLVKVMLSETARFLREKTGRSINGHYILINGPADVLRGIVGDSPRRIQSIFAQAKRKAKEKDSLVFIIFDEFESLCRIRNSMVLDAGVGNEDVNQFNAEMDGVEELENVVVVAISNRPDNIDPAVIRPGRFDLKIEVTRPDRSGAAKIFRIYLEPDLPVHADYRAGNQSKVIDGFISKIVEHCYDPELPDNQLLEITYDDTGEVETFNFSGLMSGALIENICLRAKKIARKRWTGIPETDVEGRQREGLRMEDLFDAVRMVLRSEIKLPSGQQALEEWLQVEGSKFRKVRSYRPLFLNNDKRDEFPKPDRRIMS